MKIKTIKLLGLSIASLLLFSCEDDFLKHDNKEYVAESQILELASSSPEALLVISEGISQGTGAYLRQYNTAGYANAWASDFGQKAIDLGLDLMSNDMVDHVNSWWFGTYYNYEGRLFTEGETYIIWNFYYKIIKNMNDVINFIPNDPSIADDLKYVKGRALALRGFAYFNLLRLYTPNAAADTDPGIPVYDGSSFVGQPRTDVGTVKANILADLDQAYTLIDGYARPTKQEVDKPIVAGFLARYHLQYGNYAEAATYAAEAKVAGTLMNETQILDGFDEISNPEWMWAADIDAETSSVYASFFSQAGNLNPGYTGIIGHYKNVDKRIYDAIPATDIRLKHFDGENRGLHKYAHTKFVDATFFEGDYLFMRAAEFYLIEAEAKAMAGDEPGARQALFDLVSTRDSAYTLSTNSGSDLMDEIKMQRKIELWGEGFSFYDMKRWGEGLTRDYEGSNHSAFGKFNKPAGSKDFTLQIPEDEINANSEINAEDQNP